MSSSYPSRKRKMHFTSSGIAHKTPIKIHLNQRKRAQTMSEISALATTITLTQLPLPLIQAAVIRPK